MYGMGAISTKYFNFHNIIIRGLCSRKSVIHFEMENVTLQEESYPSLELALYIIQRWVIFVIFGIGFIGNTISLFITSKREYRQLTTGLYMSGLAVLDNFVLIFGAAYNILAVHGLGDTIRDRMNFHM